MEPSTVQSDSSLGADLQKKYVLLQSILREYGSVVVAFSAGVDSTLLLKVARDVLGDRVLAVAGVSDSFPASEASEAKKLARSICVTLMEINTAEMLDENYLQNPPNRCFHCKSELFGRLREIAAEQGYRAVVDGSNADDAGDFRPGMLAGQQKGVRSPLRDAELTKDDIRNLSRFLGLPTWNKPAMACLSSRIPYGQRITAEKLHRIEQAEGFLRHRGFSQVRVRCHDDVARIEVPPDSLPSLIDSSSRDEIIACFKELGFTYVTVDLQGYRSGSMNERISAPSGAA